MKNWEEEEDGDSNAEQVSQVRLVRGDSDKETAERVRDEQTKNQLEDVVNVGGTEGMIWNIL